MTDDDIVNFWGKENLTRWTTASLQEDPLPVSSKAYLIEVGLPVGVDWTLRFDPHAGDLSHHSGPRRFRTIGTDGPVPICLDRLRNGAVVATEDEIGGAFRCINSCVERFGECLVYYQQYRLVAPHTPESDIQSTILATREKMTKADPPALSDAANWWPLIFEQMGDGLL